MKQGAALRLAVWRNDAAAVEELLVAGVKPDVQDEESGWSCLHHALYWGHLGVAARLISAGSSLHLPDHQGRTPLDLLSRELQAYLQAGTQAELFAWGNGANFQLGTGGTGLAAMPIRLDVLRHAGVVALAAAKFHSAAVTADGKLLTWGWGRGGRLGHADFEIHSGESATIVPRPVASLMRQVVVAVAAAKHHTAAITAEGELYTWGANRHCQLGYNVDTQPTPRKITTIRVRWAGVGVANKHTLAVTDGGAVYSWGDNSQGQLGYGTTDSAANGNPRVVEAMKGKRVTAVAAAKRHSLARTAEGDVWTWGHCGVSPRRVQLVGVRDVQRLSGKEAVFHKGQTAVARPIAVRITAGAAHSSCLTQDGVVLVWRSSDPMLQAHEASGALAGRTVVSISAGKYRTAAVTNEGDVFMWEGWSQPLHAGGGGPGRLGAPQLPPAPPPGSSPGTSASLQKRQRNRARAERLAEHVVPAAVGGLKRAACVAVGEKHSLAVQHWCCKPLAAWPFDVAAAEQADALDDDSSVEQEVQTAWAGSQLKAPARRFPWEAEDGVPTLQRVCERAVSRELVEPRSVCGVLLYADAAGANMLRQYCLAVAVSNLDAVLLEARESLEALPEHLLADMAELLQLRFLQPASAEAADELQDSILGAALRSTRRPTAAVLSEEDGASEHEAGRASLRSSPSKGAHLQGMPGSAASFGSERSFKSEAAATEDAAAFRQVRHLRKKLQQIEALEARAAEGDALDAQQATKVAQRPQVVAALAALAAGAPVSSLPGLLAPQTSEQDAYAEKALADKVDHPSADEGSAAIGGRVGRQQRRQRKQREGAAAALPPGPELKPVTSGSSAQPTQAVSPATAANTATAAAPVTAGSMQVTAGFTVASEPQSAAARDSASAAATTCAVPARKAAKPPRKGGLSLFLRGDLDKEAATEAVTSAAPAAPRGWGPPTARAATLHAALPPAHGLAAPAAPAAPKGWGAPAAALLPSALGTAQGLAASSAASLHSSSTEVSGLTAGLVRQRLEADSRAPEGQSPVLLPRARSGSGSRSLAGSGAPAQRQQPETTPPSSGRRVSLADFVSPKSAPIPMRNTPPAWGSAKGASPTNGLPSLRDIQAAQEQHRESMAANWTPLGTSPGQGSAPTASWRIGASPQAGALLGTPPGALFPAGTSPSSRRTPQRDAPSSKWFVPEEHVVVPLREIEREEQEEQLRAQEEAEELAAIAAAKAAEKAQRKAEAKQRARAAKAAAAQVAAAAALGAAAAVPTPGAAAQTPAHGNPPTGTTHDKVQQARRSRGASRTPAPAAREPVPGQQEGAGTPMPKRRSRGPRSGRPGRGHSRPPLDAAGNPAVSNTHGGPGLHQAVEQATIRDD